MAIENPTLKILILKLFSCGIYTNSSVLYDLVQLFRKEKCLFLQMGNFGVVKKLEEEVRIPPFLLCYEGLFVLQYVEMCRKYGNMKVWKMGMEVGMWPCVYICCIPMMS